MKVDLDALELVVSPRLAPLGYEVVLIEQVTLHGRPTLRVYIDGPNGVALDDCVKVNRLLMGMPELEAEITESFDFEVSSPGVERPLRRAEHFQSVIGEQVKVKLRSAINGRKKVTGRVVAVTEGVVTLDVEGEHVDFPLDGIVKARVKPDYAAILAAAERATS